VQEIADVLKNNKEITVLVKNPMNPDVNLWIGAIKRIQQAGVQRIIAVHRGFSVYRQQSTVDSRQSILSYRNSPQWYLPIELKRQMPKLPLICDPSHIAGNRDLVAGLCQKALDLDFDGLMIESHCSPDEAWSDATQQLTPAQLKDVLDGLVVHDRVDRDDELAGLRSQIDSLDTMLIETLAKRMQVSKEIGKYKRQNNMPIVQTGRYNDVIQNRLELAELLGLSEQLVKKIY
jgi:chorismate mutase